jgi:hypothetical protein
MHLQRITLGPWYPSLLIKWSYDVNGFLKPREMLMDPLKDIKLVWLPRVSIKYLVWILKRLTALS